jgi:hypothetical protein
LIHPLRPLGCPTATRFQATHHPSLRPFMPRYRMRFAPSPDVPIALITPPSASFLMTQERHSASLYPKRFQCLAGRTNEYAKGQTPSRQIDSKAAQGREYVGHVTFVALRASKPIGLNQKKTDRALK